MRRWSAENFRTPEEQLRRLAANRFAIGTPAQVIEALVAQHRAGITHLAMRVSWPGVGQDAQRHVNISRSTAINFRLARHARLPRALSPSIFEPCVPSHPGCGDL